MPLSWREIALQKINARVRSFQTDLCTIKRPAKSYDSTGALTGVKETVASNVPCRVIKGQGDLDDIGEQQTLTEWYTLSVPAGTEIGAGYTIILDDGSVDGVEYQILSMIGHRTEATDTQAIMKREVR